jgi:hypothetical protein
MDIDKIVAALGAGVVATDDGVIIRGPAIRALEGLIDRKATIEKLSLLVAYSHTLMAVNGEQFAALTKAFTLLTKLREFVGVSSQVKATIDPGSQFDADAAQRLFHEAHELALDFEAALMRVNEATISRQAASFGAPIAEKRELN